MIASLRTLARRKMEKRPQREKTTREAVRSGGNWCYRSTWANVSNTEPPFLGCFVTVHAPEALSQAGSGTLLHTGLATLCRALAPFGPWRQKPFWVLHQRTLNNITGVLLTRTLHFGCPKTGSFLNSFYIAPNIGLYLDITTWIKQTQSMVRELGNKAREGAWMLLT